MFYLLLFILTEIIFGKETLCLIIPHTHSQEYTSSVNMVNPYVLEGVSEVLTSDVVPVIGNTNIEGSVPVTGAVTFEGQVHASGTVIIVAKSRPSTKPKYKASKCKTPSGNYARAPIMVVTPYSQKGRKMPIVPLMHPTKTLPITPAIPPVYSPVPHPIMQVTPTIFSSTFLPITTATPSVPKITAPSISTEEITGYNTVGISEDELPLPDSTFIDAVSLKIEDVAFGYIPAKGSVFITCKSF